MTQDRIERVNLTCDLHPPVVVFKVLVEFSLVVHGARPARKLLVLPGIGHRDPIGPQRQKRDRAWETETELSTAFSLADAVLQGLFSYCSGATFFFSNFSAVQKV